MTSTSTGSLLHEIVHGEVIISETIYWSVLESDCFYMHDSVYRVLDEDSSGDVIFPLNEKCIQLSYRAGDFHHSEDKSRHHLNHKKWLYEALKKRYLYAKHSDTIMYPDILSKLPTIHTVENCGTRLADRSQCCCRELKVLRTSVLVVPG